MQARIVVLASPIAAQVLKYNPWQLQVKAADEKWDLLRMLTQVRKERFDLAVSLSQRGGFFTRFCATPVWSDFTLTAIKADRSVVEMCQDVLRIIGIDSDERETEFWYRSQEEHSIELFLRSSAFSGEQPLVAVHVGGHFFIRKRWALTNFIETIRFLTDSLGLQVVLIGGQEDVEESLIIKSLFPRIISSVGILKLAETAALLKQCSLFIGNDSGPLHLAAALHIPTIGLFGPTDPRQFYPYRAPLHRFIYKGLSCSPCYRFGGGIWQYVPRCSKAYCMEAITINELTSVVRELLLLPFFTGEQRGASYAGRT